MERTLVTNIGLLASPEGRQARGGAAQGSIRFLKDAWILCVDILGISELKWTGMGEFTSDDHYIYYCGRNTSEEME